MVLPPEAVTAVIWASPQVIPQFAVKPPDAVAPVNVMMPV
jgi:hypothetical protein